MDRDRALVAAHRTALLEAGFLLTGDEQLAEDRAHRALARLPADADRAAALAALARTRDPRGRVTGGGADPWWVSPAELAAARRTAAALAALATADRTAVLLAAASGRPLPPAAGALGADPGGALDGLLAVRRPPVLTDADAAVVVRDHRRAARRRPLLAVAVLVVLALLVPVVRALPRDPAPADRDTALEAPTRGSAAGDDAFLAAVTEAAFAGEPTPTDRRVVFAGDELDARWVLVVGTVDGELSGRWSLGPPGAAAEEMVPANRPVTLRPDQPAALLAGTALLVVAAPDEGVRVSTGQVVGPAGTVQRVFTALPVDAGVGTLRLAAPDPGGVAVRVQVARAGEFSNLTLAPVPVTVADLPVGPAAPVPELSALRSSSSPSAAAVGAALSAVAVPTGLDPATLRPTLLWAGALPDPLGGTVDAAVLAVPVPSGAVVLSTAWADRLDDGTLQQNGCGLQTSPAGTDVAALVVAARCNVADRETTRVLSTLLVTAPAGTAGLALVDGTTTTPLALTDGLALVDDDRATTAVVLPDGTRQAVTVAGPDDLFDE